MRLFVLGLGVSFLAGCVLDEPPSNAERAARPPANTNPTQPPGSPSPVQPPSTCTPGGATVQFVDHTPITEPARPPPPISGGTLTAFPDGTLVAADSDRDLLYLVGEDREVRTVALLPDDEPGRVVAGPTGRAFVALRRAGKVAELDLVAGAVVARHDACPAPRGLAWSDAQQQLAVACATGDLARLSFSNGALASTTTAHPADDLRDVAFTGDRLQLSTFREAKLFELSPGGGLSAKPALAPRPNLGPQSEYRIHVPRVAWRTVVAPAATYVVHQRAQESALATSTVLGCQTTGYGGSVASDLFGSLHSVVSKVSNGQATEVAVMRDAVLPVDLAVAPDESSMVVASPNAGVHLVAGGKAQLLLTVTPQAQFTAVAYQAGQVVAFSRQPAMLYFVAPKVGAPVTTLPLSAVSVKSTGHDLFHTATANAIACASCHPEAGEDGHVWVLPEGRRRTPSLRGGLSGTEPFHWSGDQNTITALMSDVLVRRMGGTAQSPERAKAGLAWLDRQPKLPAPMLDPAAVVRGKDLFGSTALGCAACHGGELGTNNANANVGTGTSLQVPRLVELAHRAPYFHDGRVPTLAARFTPVGGGDSHGYVSHLTQAQISDLVAYLKSR